MMILYLNVIVITNYLNVIFICMKSCLDKSFVVINVSTKFKYINLKPIYYPQYIFLKSFYNKTKMLN